MMDEMDAGFTLCHSLKKQYPGTPTAAQAAQAEAGLLGRVREEEQTGLMQLHEEVIALRFKVKLRNDVCAEGI